MQGEPAMSTEARELLALVDSQKKNPLLLVAPVLAPALQRIAAYVQRAELRMYALETTAQSLAEQVLDYHYGRVPGMPDDRLRAIATAARHEPTLRALDEAKRRG
jgi:hypothetical protein